MGAFHFELESVLEMRRNAERQKQLALARLELQRLDVERRIALVQGRIITQRDDLRERLGAGADAKLGGGPGPGVGVDLGLVRLQATASVHAVLELRRLAIEAAGVLRRTELARAELLRATVARKAVDHLRVKARAAWRAALERKEAAELDDITLMRRGRGTEVGGVGAGVNAGPEGAVEGGELPMEMA